ncbi:MAG: xanthine dehydrogenase family protein subunit M [Rhizobiales bacterium]|nr:xanthine dehydrogenase family protein subunit M [Hyphomicrobiales bacterium]
MRPAPFAYHRATSLEHALALLAEHGEDGRPLAGGQSLVAMMNLRLARPRHLVDINDLPLEGIEQVGDVIRIGALVRHERYLRDDLVARYFPVIREGVACIGHPTIRRNGTTGGSLSHADPSAELPLLARLHDATIVAASLRGTRRIASADFFRGAYETALEPGEMLTHVEFTLPNSRPFGAFLEMSERRGDFAIAAVAVVMEEEAGTIRKIAIACSGASQIPIRAPGLEAALAGQSVTALAVAGSAIDAFTATLAPPGDIVATSDHRRRLIAALLARALASAGERTREGR